MTNAEKIEKLEAEIAALKSEGYLTPQEAAIEVTVCLMCCNSRFTIFPVIESFGSQGMRVDLLTAMDESSTDPTRVILEDLPRWTNNSSAIASCRFLGTIPHKGLEQTLAHSKAKFAHEAQTEYVWFNDDDVVLPPGAINSALSILRGASDIGAVCVPYSLKNDHLEHGAMLMRTSVARDVGFDGRGRCGCVNLAKDLNESGLKMVAADCRAYHMKYKTLLVG